MKIRNLTVGKTRVITDGHPGLVVSVELFDPSLPGIQREPRWTAGVKLDPPFEATVFPYLDSCEPEEGSEK